MTQLYFKDSDISEDSGLVWKTILRTGQWKYMPDENGKPIERKLSIVKGNSSDPSNEIGLQDLVDSFVDSNGQYVTVPTSHNDHVTENTGYAKQLAIAEDPQKQGEFILRAGLEFTDLDVKNKVLNKSIADTSSGIFPNYVNKETGRRIPFYLKHIALTNHPWIKGMVPFSEDNKDSDGTLVFDEEGFPKDKKKIYEFISDAISTEFSKIAGLFSEKTTEVINKIDESSTKVNKTGYNKDNKKSTERVEGSRFMAITELQDLELSEEVSARIEAAIKSESEKAATEAKLELEAKLSESESKLAESVKAERERAIEDRITELKAVGFSEFPGFLVEVKSLLLSDTGREAVLLSENSGDTSLTITQIVDRFVNAFPTKDGKINFSEQVSGLVGKDNKPPVNAKDEVLPREQRTKAALAFLDGEGE